MLQMRLTEFEKREAVVKRRGGGKKKKHHPDHAEDIWIPKKTKVNDKEPLTYLNALMQYVGKVRLGDSPD